MTVEYRHPHAGRLIRTSATIAAIVVGLGVSSICASTAFSAPVKIEPSVRYPNLPDQPAIEAQPGTTRSAVGPARRYISMTDSSGGANGWARIRVAQHDLVEGNAKTGTTFDRQSDGGAGWWGGYVFGDLGACGFILASDTSLKSGTPSTMCAGFTGRKRTDIGTYWNWYSQCPTPQECDGEPTAVACNPVPEYANVYPWGATRAGTLIRAIANPARRWSVYWRYVTKDYHYVMARDPHIKNRDGNWVFIPIGCFTFGLPDAVPMTN